MEGSVQGSTSHEKKRGLVCALCGKVTRSVYSLPGDRKARFCAACFFNAPKVSDV